MHEIQQHIIHQLITQKKCRYRDIKPKEVEGNLFMYHLRQLQKEQLLEKAGVYYQLTEKGLRFSDSFSLQECRIRIQPKIVTLIACQNSKGEWLLYERHKQPYFGQVGFPYGKIHLGEKIQEAAQRELLEKTGLTATLQHIGDAYLTIYQGDDLFSHMLCHVFLGKNPTGELQKNSVLGTCYWFGKPKKLNKPLIPGFADIFQLITRPSKKPFFEELSYQLSDSLVVSETAEAFDRPPRSPDTPSARSEVPLPTQSLEHKF